jgi:hypothetical protein
MIRKSAYLPSVHDKHNYIASGLQTHTFHEFHLTFTTQLVNYKLISLSTYFNKICLLFFPVTVLSPYNTQICSNTDPEHYIQCLVMLQSDEQQDFRQWQKSTAMCVIKVNSIT